MNYLKKEFGFTPIQIIVFVVSGLLIIGGVVGGIFYFSKSTTSIPEVELGKCGDGICDATEKEKNVCSKDCNNQEEEPDSKNGEETSKNEEPSEQNGNSSQKEEKSEQLVTNIGDNSFDADGFLWGTEATTDPKNESATINAINSTFNTNNVKLRLFSDSCTSDWKSFTTSCAVPTLKNPKDYVNIQDEVKTFKDNGWSMIPMLSYSQTDTTNVSLKSQTDIDNYVGFVIWFLDNFKKDASIKYLELENSPNIEKTMLLKANNAVYDAVKAKYPDILVGTPGFEYWDDPVLSQNMISEIEYFLDKNNGAKFDFWAFHGYASRSVDLSKGSVITYPPTSSPKSNKYANVKGILEIRKKLDANGWQNRFIMDMEHSLILKPGSSITSETDKLDAAYTLQELILKRTLQLNGKNALAGIVPFKTGPRKSVGEFGNGVLNSDGSTTMTVRAVGILWSKLNQYKYSSHVNGEWDNESQVWVEKFSSGSNKELYIFFKPFKYSSSKSISLDNQTLNHSLKLKQKPTSVVLILTDGSSINLTASQDMELQAVNSPKFLEITY